VSKKIQRAEDPKINEAFNLLKTIEAKKNERLIKDDDSDTYGRYIASELKTFDEHTRAQIKHTFNNVLYEAHICKCHTQMPQQPALHWNYTNPKAPSATFRAFSNQQFYQQTTPQHYPSTSQEPIRNIFDNPITPQENSLHSSESSASSYFQTFTDQNTDVLNNN